MLNARRQRGFNLIEGMITLVVLGILIATALPTLSEWMRGTQVRGTAEALLTGLQKARMEAMRRNQVVTFWLVGPATTRSPDNSCTLSSASAAWVVSLDDPTSKCATAPSTTAAPRLVERYGPGPSGQTLTVSALASDGATAAKSVSFNGFGLVERGGTPLARIDLTHSDPEVRQLRLQISQNGSVRMCEPAVTTAGDPRKCN